MNTSIENSSCAYEKIYIIYVCICMFMLSRINFNLEPELHEKIREQMQIQRRTQTAIIVQALNEYMERLEQEE